LTRETAFATIQKGIDSAPEGGEVLVWPGWYGEGINFLGKAITVRSAAEPAVIEASGRGGVTLHVDVAVIETPGEDAVTFHTGEGPGSVLKNFVIRHSGIAVSLNYGSSPTISNLTIVDNDFGIAAYQDSNPHISNCILWGNRDGDLFGCTAEYSSVQQEVDANLEDPADGLVSHWTFDEGAGLIAYDWAGDNDGVVFGAQWADGRIEGALDFDGANDFVQVADSASLDITERITLAAWIRRDTAGVRHNIVVKQTTTPPYDAMHLVVGRADNVGFGLTIDGSWEQCAGGQTDAGDWYHVVGTYDGSEMRIFLDGEAAGTNSISGNIALNDSSLYIGCADPGFAEYFFDGLIDDVRIYGRALTAFEVSRLHEPSGSVEPLFADAEHGDYHLLSERGRYWPMHGLWVLDEVTSPCVDGGDPGIEPLGEPMPNGGLLNMGAYGGTPQASMSEWPIESDQNHNGKVGFDDFSMFCEQWLITLPWAE